MAPGLRVSTNAPGIRHLLERPAAPVAEPAADLDLPVTAYDLIEVPPEHEYIPVTAPSARHLFLHPFPYFIRPPGFSTYFISQNCLPTSAVGASIAAHHQHRSAGDPCEGPKLEAEAGGHTPLLWPCPHHAGRVIIKNFVRRGIKFQRIKSPPRLFKKAYVYAEVLHDRKDVIHLVWSPPAVRHQDCELVDGINHSEDVPMSSRRLCTTGEVTHGS